MKHITHALCLLVFGLTAWTAQGQKLKTVQQIEGIPAKVEYRALTHDPQGNIYVATNVDVFMIPGNGYIAQPMKMGENIMDIDWSDDYGLLMLNRTGEVHFISSGKVLTLDAGGNATCMDVTKTMIWVGTANGVYTVSIPQEKIVDHFTTENSELASNEVNFIHTDPYGHRWIGTNSGVVRVEGKRWKLYEKDLPITAVTSTSEGAWMAAENKMWLVDSYNRWYQIDAWKNLVSGNVKALAADGDGMIYIASEMLVKYDPYEEKILSMNEGSIQESLILLDQGPGKNVWMAGHNGMTRILEDTTVIQLPAAKENQIAAAVEVKSTPVCEGMSTGHLMAVAQGGTPPYTYQWSHASLNSPEVTQLVAGLYQVTISDQAGKSTVASAIITSAPTLRVNTTIEANASDKLATDGKANAVIRGGTSPYQYLWSNGENSMTATKLGEGLHTLRVVDANGCIATTNLTMEAEKVLKSLEISTLTVGQTIRVDKLYFQADSTKIEPLSFGVLEEIYTFLSNNQNVAIEIGGHTNSLPEDEYCDKLSTARAKNIAEYLYDKGIPERQISYKGYGKRQPIASNATVDGRRRNQRVEIKIISL